MGDDLASIGRSVGSLPEKIRRRYPAIGWNLGGAAEVSDDGLWDAATRRVPAFGRQVGLILLDITD